MQIKTILFHGGKGGVGTTTLAAETAGSLSRRRRRVAAVDLDIFRGDLHYRLDLPLSRGTHTLADLLPVLDEVDGRILDNALSTCCLLYTSDAADDLLCVDLGGRRIIK